MLNFDFYFYWNILLRRLKYVSGIVFVCLCVALAVAYLLPSVYSSSAKILLEAPQIPAEMARSTVPVGAVEQLQIIQQQITSRDNLLELASKLGDEPGFKMNRYGEDVVREMRSRIVFDQVSLGDQGGGGTMVVSVSFLAAKPDLAAKIANQLATMILGSNQRQRTDRAGNTFQFFNQDVSRLVSELNRLEADILKFKTENRNSLPESLDFRRSQQSALQDRLISLERDEADLRTRRGNLVAGYSDGDLRQGSTPLTSEQQTLASLKRASAEQLALFSETSPNIVALRARVADIERSIVDMPTTGNQKGERREAAQGGRMGLNLQLSDIDNRLATIDVEKRDTAVKMDEMTSSIADTPATETALNSLTRNRESLQVQYNAATARRAEASIGEQIEMRADGGRFSLLEAAIPPETRLSPKRTRILAIGGAAGLVLGLALVVLLELLNKKIRSPAELMRLLQYEPFAVVPDMQPARRRARLVDRAAAILKHLTFFLSSGQTAIKPPTAALHRPGEKSP
ncbi:Wzz/FepE/Etk N-terminal domain-containing protein [Rhizobium sp. Leaf262]|uniref:GumC family protein n=1 Tax=Rhizobium sp. Leaf262 TaxID=1736312 RepID=UPI000714F14F|nr:Wzz/FepE/Etk N-terminal domain-containing protein [Rhizobium sp. Leaf262]KQO76273.1 lipopolysaccharide biosynthesis protein [Rhizobium sp. Leaf262]